MIKCCDSYDCLQCAARISKMCSGGQLCFWVLLSTFRHSQIYRRSLRPALNVVNMIWILRNTMCLWPIVPVCMKCSNVVIWISCRYVYLRPSRFHVRTLVEEPPPILVAVVGPPKVGKTTLIQSLVKHYTRRNIGDAHGPITVVSGV